MADSQSSQHARINRQRPTSMPVHKYGRYDQVDIPDRDWPNNRITVAPAGSPRICATATRP